MPWLLQEQLRGFGLSAASPPQGWQCKAQLEFLGLYILLEGLNK